MNEARMKKHILILLCVATVQSVAVMAAANETHSTVKQLEHLTLEQALELAESLQPQLAEARAMVEAADGRARQADTFPNPEAILGAQQIPFSGSAANEREYVAGIGQTVPLSRRLSSAREACRHRRICANMSPE